MLSIVLVCPQMAENIGMVARVMLNFSIHNLVIVNPKNKDFFDTANLTSCEALQQLNLEVTNETDIDLAMKKALNNFHNIFALTARKRGLSKSSFYIEDLLDNINNNQNNAFMFGRERTGLTNNELSFANRIISINSNTNFPSLNLAQSVGICCYEYSKMNRSINNIDTTLELATSKENEIFLDDLFNRLNIKGFFSDIAKKEQNQHNIKNIFQKSLLTSKEINILRGIVKSLDR